MFGIGYQELLVIFLIILIFYGGTKIPEVARGLGKGLREFKKAKDGLEESMSEPEEAAKKEPDKQEPKEEKKG